MVSLEFKQVNDKVFTFCNNDGEHIGTLEKLRVGRWMSWCLLLKEGCYLSASCQDEVRDMTRVLNACKDL